MNPDPATSQLERLPSFGLSFLICKVGRIRLSGLFRWQPEGVTCRAQYLAPSESSNGP